MNAASAWPNSWNIVVTLSHVSRAGCPSAGLVKLQVLVITGRVPKNAERLKKALVQAPPFLLSRLK